MYLPIGNGTCCCCYYGNFCFLFLPLPFWFLCVLCVRLCWYSGRKSKSTCSAWPIDGKRGEIIGSDPPSLPFFSTFSFHFLLGVAWVVEKEMEECIVRLFTFNVLRTFLTLLLSFFLFLQILSICAFYVFSSYDFEYTRHIHSHTHKLMKETKEKMAAHAKNIHTPSHTLEVVCVCPFFCTFLHLYWPLFYENFWRDLILAPS